MFATIEEATKAAAMLRRFGGWQSDVVPGGDGAVFGYVLDLGHDEPLTDWEELADLLLERWDDDAAHTERLLREALT